MKRSFVVALTCLALSSTALAQGGGGGAGGAGGASGSASAGSSRGGSTATTGTSPVGNTNSAVSNPSATRATPNKSTNYFSAGAPAANSATQGGIAPPQ